MKDDDLDIEYRLYTLAIFAARKAVGLKIPERAPDDPWWFEGPHIEKDGRCYYVHAMGSFRSELGRATHEHPDWYLIAATVRGNTVYLHGLDDPRSTLAEVQKTGEFLSADEKRLALELTPAEKRERWGVFAPEV